MLRVDDLGAHAFRAERGEAAQVVHAVVLDGVAAGDDLAQQRRRVQRLGADDEEAGAGAGGVEQVEHLRRHFGLRAVVDGQCDLAARCGVCRQPAHVRAD